MKRNSNEIEINVRVIFFKLSEKYLEFSFFSLLKKIISKIQFKIDFNTYAL